MVFNDSEHFIIWYNVVIFDNIAWPHMGPHNVVTMLRCIVTISAPGIKLVTMNNIVIQCLTSSHIIVQWPIIIIYNEIGWYTMCKWATMNNEIQWYTIYNDLQYQMGYNDIQCANELQ